MPILSAGLLLYRRRSGLIEVLLVHPGGPFWRKKDAGAWSIPKGEADAGEDLLAAARREFAEETGAAAPGAAALPLTPIKLKNGKIVHAWAVEGDFDLSAFCSNTFTLEWPPRSGKMAEFPEVDRAEFFDLPAAMRKINPAQSALLAELERLLDGDSS